MSAKRQLLYSGARCFKTSSKLESKACLPQFLPQVSIRDLKVGDASVDLLLTRHDEGDVGVNVLRRNGILDVVVLK